MHSHTYEHEHAHEHAPHHHDQDQHIDPAHLLTHMYEHNISHTNELKQVAETLEGEAANKVLDAAASFEEGNQKLAEAIELIKEA